jgi:hypothetical protein
MSALAQKWAEAQKIADPTLMAVLRSVAWFANRGTGICTKSQAEIACRAGLQIRALRNSLSILERLEIIHRRPRSRGNYGRTTDEISLSVERNFDISRGAIKGLRAASQPAQNASSEIVAQPAPNAGATGTKCRAYNQVNQEDYPTKRIKPNRTSYYAHTRGGAGDGWDEAEPFGRVVAFRGRGSHA